MEITDYLTVRCREAGHTDEAFIDAARFGAKCLCERLTGDDPIEIQDRYDHSKQWCSIWRSVNERPKDDTTIVLCNAAMVQYAYYKSEMFYYEGYSDRLTNFVGRWCYKDDLFGVSPKRVYYAGNK